MSDQVALRQWSMCILEAAFLRCSKHNAVVAEDYDRAHLIKQIESETSVRLTAAKQSFLKSSNNSPLAARIQVLEEEKQAAVEEENFDLAHAIKEQLLELERYTDSEALDAAVQLLDDVGMDVFLLTCDASVAESLAHDNADVWTSAATELRESLTKRATQASCFKTKQDTVAQCDSNDVAALPISQLKAKLRARGVEHAHCVEKAELCSLLTASSKSHQSQPGQSDKDRRSDDTMKAPCEEVEGAPVNKPLDLASDNESSDSASHGKRSAGRRRSSKEDKKRDKKREKKRRRKDKKRKKKAKKIKKDMKKLLKQARKQLPKKRVKDKTNSKDKLKAKIKRAHICVSSSSTSGPSSSSSLDPDDVAVEFAKAAAQGDNVRAQHIVSCHGFDWQSASGDGPLHIAARFNQTVLVDFLLRQHNACRFLEVQNDLGDTALLIAARLFRGRVALRLVEALADPGVLNKNGESPESLDLDGLVREAEQDEKFRQAAAGEKLLSAVSAARKVREDLEWRSRVFEEVGESEFVRFEGHHDLESVDTGSNDWMGDVGRQAVARASAARLARQAMAAAAAAEARERDRRSKEEARAERAAAPAARPRHRSSESEAKGLKSGAQAEDEETRLAARAADEARWQVFHLSAVDAAGLGKARPLREVDVPFPSGPPENPLRLDPKAHHAVLRSQLRAGLLRWHPDKFEQRFGRLLSAKGSEQEVVLGRVKAIAQQLNLLMAELLPDAASRGD